MRYDDVVRRALLRQGLATMTRWVDGDVAADRRRLVLDMRSRYLHRAAQVPWPESWAMRVHLTQSILPGAALFDALRERGWEADAAVDAVAGLIARRSQPQRRRLQRLVGHRAARAAFLPVAVRWTTTFFPPPGWVTQWRERTTEAVAFDITHCYFLETFTLFGMPELTRSYCAGDDVMYADLCPQLRWLRTGTLGTGAEACDFRFERHEAAPAG